MVDDEKGLTSSWVCSCCRYLLSSHPSDSPNILNHLGIGDRYIDSCVPRVVIILGSCDLVYFGTARWENKGIILGS